MTRDRVLPEVAEAVFARDARQVWLRSEEFIHHKVSFRKFWTRRIICVAPALDRSQSGACWGRTTIEHVKSELRAGKRAESDPAHLVSLCQAHTEDGRTAGHQWNTTKEHRALVRDYLKEVDVIGHEQSEPPAR